MILNIFMGLSNSNNNVDTSAGRMYPH